ncbi:hypothetical protein RF679_14605 [Undibacterium cyanobacteriorum]|uniref:Metallo-beta-lactamase domain-containing protein n=1 Tax=Undibacterium cyanobacteriorum TaxID=3073561 RepID=A0ABY9RF63_9BURK|nr:hypothetical protein [Undibacterium sp. 20NA77.5]WMW79867.1 hypothetical protein RF679_14605 [Undibacterium sp. 20NA77.5]
MIGSRITPNQARQPVQASLEVPAHQTVYLSPTGAFEIRTDTEYPGGIRFNFHIKGNHEGMATVDTLFWRNGDEIERSDASVAKQTYADQVLLVPELLMSQAQNVRDIESPADAHTDYIFKGFEDFIGRPVSVTIRRGDSKVMAARLGSTLYVYDYEAATRTPNQWNVHVSNNGATSAHWQIQSQAVRQREITLDFAAPYREKAARGDLRIDTLAPGVYRVNGAPSNYHSHFVLGDHSMLAFDAPVSSTETALIRTKLENLIPQKAIEHVVLSHTHRDHIAGLLSYTKQNAKVYLGKGGQVAVQRQFGSSLDQQLVEIKGDQIIDLGNRRIHLASVHSRHAEEMLVAFDEQSGIVFQGDLLTLAEHGPVATAFEVNQELFDLIKARAWSVTAIVGVHGRVSNMEELKQSLELKASRER